MSETTTNISHVYPVARAFGFGEPTAEVAIQLLDGSSYGRTVFVKDGLQVTFFSIDGEVGEVGVVKGESFLATAEADAFVTGIRALAGVDVLS